MNITHKKLLSILLLLGFSLSAMAETEIQVPEVALTGIPFDVSISDASDTNLCNYSIEINQLVYQPDDCMYSNSVNFSNIVIEEKGSYSIGIMVDEAEIATEEINVLWGWLSVLPPLFAILMALTFKSVIPALFLGIWIGSFSILGFNITVLGQSFLDIIARYIKNSLANTDHAAIIIFTLMIGGLVGIISKNGGMLGVVNSLMRFTTNAKRGQLITSLLGIAIFFDDYANTLVVGNTMRKVTDKLKISRAKLAFLVDSTAAPIACIALITTWVGYQLGMIDASIGQINEINESAYYIYLNSILYSFYPVFMLVFVLTIAGSGRDFAAMHKYEIAARAGEDYSLQGAETGYTSESESKQLEPKEPMRAKAYNATIPILIFIGSVIAGLFMTGEGDSIMEIIGSADAYQALLWGSLIAVIFAVLLTLVQGIMSLEETVQSWYEGIKFMIFAIIILIMAWSLGETTEILQTAKYLVSVLGAFLPVAFIPTIVFILSAATAFATGTSWGTMGIFYPIVVPLVWQVLLMNGLADPDHMFILYSSVACVLSGAVWGDHCSPISDTTILSSMASGCSHIDHVTTQLPYAITVASIALLLGTIPTGFGISPWIMILIGLSTVVASVFILGKKVD